MDWNLHVQTRLADFFGEFIASCKDAFRDELRAKAASLSRITSRSTAGSIHDRWYEFLKRRLGSHPDVRFYERNQLQLMQIDNEFDIAIKKLSTRLVPYYSPTQQALQFYDEGRGHPVLPGMLPPIFQLTLGCRFNPTSTWYKDIWLVGPKSQSPRIEVPILPVANLQAITPLPIPSTPVPSRRIAAKSVDKKKVTRNPKKS